MQALQYVVRVVLVFPFVLACAAIWAVLGLVFWIPTLTFAMVAFQYSIFRNLSGGPGTQEPYRNVVQSGLYYLNGFIIILSVLSKKAERSDAASDKEDVPTFWDDFRNIADPLMKKISEVFAAWAVIAALVWFSGLWRPEFVQRFLLFQ